MKALVKFAKGPGNVEIRDVDDPPCGADQVKLEVSWCGICGTDLHVYHDTFRNFPPVILGHEMSATVVESGSKVQGLALGDRFLYSRSFCRHLRRLRLLPQGRIHVLSGAARDGSWG